MGHGLIRYQGKRYVLMAVAYGILLVFSNVHAGMSQSQIDEITASWTCKWCPYEKEAYKKGEVEAGVGGVSNDSFRQGKYTGLDEKGIYPVGNGKYEYKDSDSNFTKIEVRDIGLDSKQVEAEGGLQGEYDVKLKYSMLPSLNLDTARTPYGGGVNQTLPTGWVQSANTAGMTELANALGDVNIYSERKTLNVGATYHVSPSLSYDLNFEQQTKEGRRTMGLALLTNSVILAVPIDHTTKQGGVKVNYHAGRWQGSAGYEFSIFSNAHDRVLWENAYTTPATATQGQAALEPENKMQRLSLNGAYHFSSDAQATLAVSLGHMTQDADFLPYTVNGTLSPSSLPRSSLGGEVNTFNSTVRLYYRWSEDWNYSVKYRHNEQANDTPRSTYSYIFADFVASPTPRKNFPYSFREKEITLQGRYQIDAQRHIQLGYVHVMDDRTYQEVDSSNEDIFSAVYRSEANEQLQWFVRLKTSKREGEYMQVAELSPPEDILLRKYNLANRKRNSAGLSLSYLLTDNLQLSAYGDYASDDYSDSDVGLQESSQSTYSLEIQYNVSDSLNINIDYSATSIKSAQEGSAWSADNKDLMRVLHGGVNYDLAKYKVLLGADIAFANAVGDIEVSTGDGFPSLKSTRKTITLFADYSLSNHSVIHAFFTYENYDEENWAVEDVAPNTIDNVLSLGEVSPSYDIGMFAISYKTQF